MKTHSILLASTALAGAAVANASYAQTAPQAGTAAEVAAATQAQSMDNNGLEDIVVTAQKRSENLQKVPIAVTARTGEDLRASGIDSTLKLNGISAGLNVRTGLGSLQPTIRGVGTSSNVGENTAAIYIDGVYIASQRDSARDLSDIVQVAVLKGPQGTLFGRNATGGVIQITTRSPSDEFGGELVASIDNYATFRGNAYITGGLAEGVSANLSMNYAHQGKGYGDNLTTGDENYRIRHQYGFASKVKLDLGDSTVVTLAGDFANRNSSDNIYVNYPGTLPLFPGYQPVPDAWDSRGGKNAEIAFQGGGGSVTIDHDFDFAKLLSITAYRKSHFQVEFEASNVPTADFSVSIPKGYGESFTQELQLVSPKSDTFNWVAGLFYIYNVIGNGSLTQKFQGLFAGAPNVHYIGRENANSVAPFGQLSWNFLESTKLTVGGRYTIEKRTLDGSKTLQFVDGTSAFTPYTGSTSVKKFNFRVALDHQFSPDVLGYAAISTGIKSGGFNVFSVDVPGFRPENLTDYEVGVKTELFDRRLRLNVSAFYYDYKDIQVVQAVNALLITTNGAAARIYGIDVDIDAQFTRDLRFTTGLELLSPKYTDFKNTAFTTPLPTGGSTSFIGDATGNRLQGAQKYAITTAFNYRREGAYGALNFNLSTNFNGDYYFEPDNFLRQGAYVDMNTSLEWTSPSEKFSVTLFAKNWLDKAVITQGITTPFLYAISYSQPSRTFGISGRVRF